MKRTFFIIGLVFVLFSCDEDDQPAFQQQPFVGDWEIASSVLDGTLIPEWTGLSMRFEQTSLTSGTYHIPQSPVELIWPKTGSWEMEDKHSFFRDDGYKVNIVHFSDSTVQFRVSIIPEDYDTCFLYEQDTVCLPVVPGNWHFSLKK